MSTEGEPMDTETQPAYAFQVAHARVREINRSIAPIEEHYLSIDGSGRAGMEASGVLEDFKRLSQERTDLIAEVKRMRTEVGDEAILAGLAEMKGGEAAAEYIKTVPLEGQRVKSEASKEVRKGFFGRFR
jgi:hypothetical protein